MAAEYYELGYPVHFTSATRQENLEKLIEELRDKTSVLIGPSGVGKTALLNAIEPEANFKTGEISRFSNKGKHTTTFAQLVPLQIGGFIVDTPGLREFGLVNIKKSELSLYFPEMIEPRQYCRFNNCTHFHEPGCGIAEAYAVGDISASRYNSYLNILESLPDGESSAEAGKRPCLFNVPSIEACRPVTGTLFDSSPARAHGFNGHRANYRLFLSPQ